MKALRIAILAAVVGGAVPLVWATPALAVRALAVTPSTGLVELDSVTIQGTGFNPSVDVGYCQAVEVAPPSPSNCGTSPGLARTSPEGQFSTQQTVRRFIYIPSLGRTVDCGSETCVIAAAELGDIAGTVTLVPISFAPAPPPPATRGSVSITPETPLDGEQVTVTGGGFRPGAEIEILQCVTDPQDPTDCSPNFTTAVADGAGAFSEPYIVSRFFSPPGASTVDCSLPGVCVMAAAEVVDIPGTITTAPLDITAASQPDGHIRRRSDGAITGDDVYSLDGSGQTTRKAVAPDTRWTFALQVENDGETVDNITVAAPPAVPPFTVRYFLGYFDITALVTGGGFTFTDMAPGQIHRFAVQFSVPGDAPLESRFDSLVTFASGSSAPGDAVLVGVVVRSAP